MRFQSSPRPSARCLCDDKSGVPKGAGSADGITSDFVYTEDSGFQFAQEYDPQLIP